VRGSQCFCLFLVEKKRKRHKIRSVAKPMSWHKAMGIQMFPSEPPQGTGQGLLGAMLSIPRSRALGPGTCRVRAPRLHAQAWKLFTTSSWDSLLKMPAGGGMFYFGEGGYMGKKKITLPFALPWVPDCTAFPSPLPRIPLAFYFRIVSAGGKPKSTREPVSDSSCLLPAAGSSQPPP